MQNYFSKSVSQTLALLDTSANGISQNQAQQRLQKYGENKLEQKNKGSLFKLFLSQFAESYAKLREIDEMLVIDLLNLSMCPLPAPCVPAGAASCTSRGYG